MTEFEEAIKIANLWLDKPYEDPDSDTCILARQFLRLNERTSHPREEVQPVTEVTVEEFERQVFGYLTENCLLDRCEIHGAILNAADKFPHGIKIKAGGG